MSSTSKTNKNTTSLFLKKKKKKQSITVLTAYDAFIAKLLDQAGIDAILVGDSVGNVLHGFSSTVSVTMEIMLLHTAAVARGNANALIIADMPFMSFQPSIKTAIKNAGRFLQEANAEAVKIEGGIEIAPTVKRIVELGIPVMGHIGLTPQSIHKFGGPKVQGKENLSRNFLIESALALEEAGCFSLVIELVEKSIAREITSKLSRTATIGIGAGVECDGQVLVINDILGLKDSNFKPKFLREYANLSPIISDAVKKYIADVESKSYPSDEESF